MKEAIAKLQEERIKDAPAAASASAATGSGHRAGGAYVPAAPAAEAAVDKHERSAAAGKSACRRITGGSEAPCEGYMLNLLASTEGLARRLVASSSRAPAAPSAAPSFAAAARRLRPAPRGVVWPVLVPMRLPPPLREPDGTLRTFDRSETDARAAVAVISEHSGAVVRPYPSHRRASALRPSATHISKAMWNEGLGLSRGIVIDDFMKDIHRKASKEAGAGVKCAQPAILSDTRNLAGLDFPLVLASILAGKHDLFLPNTVRYYFFG